MDALLAINAGTHAADAIIPAKVPQKHEDHFGKVLHKKRHEHQPEKKSAGKSIDVAKHSEPKQAVARQQAAEVEQAPVEQTAEDNAIVVNEVEDVSQGVVEEATLPEVEVVSSDEVTTVEADSQLSELVETLEVSTDDGDVEVGDVVNPAQSLAPLPAQPVEAVVAPQNVEQVVVAAVEPQQQVIVAAENRVVASPSDQKLAETPAPVVEGENEVILPVEQKVAPLKPEEGIEHAAADGEKVDPRFAALLKPRAEKQPTPHLKEAVQLHGSKVETPQAEVVTLPPAEGSETKQTVELSQLGGHSAKEILTQLSQTGHHLQGQGQVHAQGFETAKAMPQIPMVQLSNGYQIPENQVFDQVVTQISGSINGESGRMVLRLQPAELGSLKLELKIEGDRVQAHLHAQTHQVQEVLERNLPQLRSALADQGLKIDQFLVNVDQRQTEGQFEGQAQYQQQGSEGHSNWHQQDHGSEEQMIPLAHLMQNGGGGISLHV